MTYALASDIANEFRQLTFGVSTDITQAKVDEFIFQAEAEINMYLAPKYLLPITGTQSLLILKRIEIALVASRVASILDLKQHAQPSTIKQEFNKRDYEDQARKYLEQLRNLKLILPDAVLLNSNFGMRSYTVENDIYSVFERDKEQW